MRFAKGARRFSFGVQAHVVSLRNSYVRDGLILSVHRKQRTLGERFREQPSEIAIVIHAVYAVLLWLTILVTMRAPRF